VFFYLDTHNAFARRVGGPIDLLRAYAYSAMSPNWIRIWLGKGWEGYKTWDREGKEGRLRDEAYLLSNKPTACIRSTTFVQGRSQKFVFGGIKVLGEV